MSLDNFPFFVTLQSVYAPETDFSDFTAFLYQLQQCGFRGLELNLPELSLIAPSKLLTLLKEYHLKLTWLATGAYAKKQGLSLSDLDCSKRKLAVAGCKSNINYASEAGCGIILGFFKSNPVREPQANEALFLDSLAQVCDYAQNQQVPVLLEATNRYESRVANTLEQTASIVRQIGSSNLGILPDTFHMNIEEAHPLDALTKHYSLISNLHLSDNNRHFPGYGAIDFAAYLTHLKKLDYHGTLGIEGNLAHGLLEDIQKSAAYLAALSIS